MINICDYYGNEVLLPIKNIVFIEKCEENAYIHTISDEIRIKIDDYDYVKELFINYILK